MAGALPLSKNIEPPRCIGAGLRSAAPQPIAGVGCQIMLTMAVSALHHPNHEPWAPSRASQGQAMYEGGVECTHAHEQKCHSLVVDFCSLQHD
jgi:hypothetical protein